MNHLLRGLALFAMASVLSAADLTIQGLPATCEAESACELRLQAPISAPVAWRVWEGGRLLEGDACPIQPGEPGSARFLAPQGPHLYIVQVAMGSETSIPQVLTVTEGTTPKRMRQLSGGAQPPVARAPITPSLGGLPDFLKMAIARLVKNPGDLRQVDQSFKKVVKYVEKLKIHGHITNEQFQKLLTEDYPRVTDLTIGPRTGSPTTALTTTGLVATLDRRRDLRAIRLDGFTLSGEQLRYICETHPHLETLEILRCQSAARHLEANLAPVKETLRHLKLQLQADDEAADRAFASLTGLETLAIFKPGPEAARPLVAAREPFTGTMLPPSLRGLTLMLPGEYDLSRFPAHLTFLEILNEGKPLRGELPSSSLRTLRLMQILDAEGAFMGALVRNQPNLKTFVTDLPVTNELMAGLGLELEKLSLLNLSNLASLDIRRFTRLRTFHMGRSSAQGIPALPDSVEALHVLDCANFRTEYLSATRLTDLLIRNCPECTGFGLPGTLRVLAIEHCARVHPEILKQGIRQMPWLWYLEAGGPLFKGTTHMDFFAAQPYLQALSLRTPDLTHSRTLSRPKRPDTCVPLPAPPADASSSSSSSGSSSSSSSSSSGLASLLSLSPGTLPQQPAGPSGAI